VFTGVITAVVSAFLDNVTAVVLLTPITFFIAQRLGASPVPFLISIVLASNIGGTATLIGDPPNILVGSAFDKDFNDFVVNMTPVVVVSLALYLVAARWIFRKELSEMITALEPEDIERLVQEERRIEDVPLMRKGLAVMGLTIVGFILARPLHLEAATIALAGAVVLMIVAKEDVHEILRTVEWPTLFFFVGLFILVGAVVKVGIISAIAQAAIGITGGNSGFAAMLVLWMSAILSAIVDNIPYTATMIPLVQELKGVMDIEPVIWALVLGADFGGNATVIGASANVVVASMSESRGYPITFGAYLRYGIPAALLTMSVATADILIRTAL
jgi:Na+/H+ antiporter NhaD/arsenite permease-like protein